MVLSLTQLTLKGQEFVWDAKCEESFQELKKRLTSALVLTLPNPSESFVVYCDASKMGLGGVLMQNRHVVAYDSRQFKVHEKNYQTHDLDLATIVFVLKVWMHYLYGSRFEVFNDHNSLKYMFDHKELSMRQRRWLKFLKANMVANALSRKSIHMSSLMVRKLELLEQFRDISLESELMPSGVKLEMLKLTSNIFEGVKKG